MSNLPSTDAMTLSSAAGGAARLGYGVGGAIADSAPTPKPGAAGPIDRAVHRGS
jgi:hypothetical protein